MEALFKSMPPEGSYALASMVYFYRECTWKPSEVQLFEIVICVYVRESFIDSFFLILMLSVIADIFSDQSVDWSFLCRFAIDGEVMLHYLATLPPLVFELLLICCTICFIWFLALLAWVPAFTGRLIRLIEALRWLWKK
jgi:hypothetical protein